MPGSDFVLPALSALTRVAAQTQLRPLTWPQGHRAVPSFSLLQPGDLVLVRGENSRIGAAIERVQGSISSGAHPNGDPSWSHSGIYVEGGLMLDAVPRLGVRFCPLEKYLQTRDLCFRRLTVGTASISALQGAAVVRVAAEFFESKYSIASIAAHFINPAKISNPSAFFCSTFIAVVYARALKVMLDSDARYQPLLPATLARHPSFTEVPVRWCTPAEARPGLR